jgi:phospho-N-acetylmuramoyl-pentapeptide-transferase
MISPVAKSFFISLLVSGVLAPIIFRLLLRTNSRQTISEHVQEHAHKQGTPTMGGLIILAGFFAGSMYTMGRQAIVPLLLTAAYALIGFVDDFVVPRMMQGKRGLGWKQKLILQIVLTYGILRVGTADLTLIGLGIFLVLFFSNAYNFSDGLDALAGSLGVILATSLGVLSVLSGKVSFTPALMAALVGGFLPFLWFNAPPAKVFMGDVGALPIGALLGYTFLEVPARSVALAPVLLLIPLTILAIVMIAELVPVPLQVASVKLRGKRLFPRTPIHHSFQMAGWPETRVVWMFTLVQFVCAVAAVSWMAWLVDKLP